MSDLFLVLASFTVGVLVSAGIAYRLGKLAARRQMADERRSEFRLIKPAKLKTVSESAVSNVYEFPIG